MGLNRNILGQSSTTRDKQSACRTLSTLPLLFGVLLFGVTRPASAGDTYVWPDAAHPDFYTLVSTTMQPGDSLVMLDDASYLHKLPLFVTDIEIFAPDPVTITAIAVDEVAERPVAFFLRARVKNVTFEWDDAGFEIWRDFGGEGGQSYFDTCTFVGSSARGSGDPGGPSFRHCPVGPSTFIGCTFIGGEGGDAVAGSGELQAGEGGAGLELADGSVCTLVKCAAQGGNGGDGVDPTCLGDDLSAGPGGDGLIGDYRETALEPSTTTRGSGGVDLDCFDGIDHGVDGTDHVGSVVPMAGYTYAISSGPGGILSIGTQNSTGPTALFLAAGTSGSPGDLHGVEESYSLDASAFLAQVRIGDVFLGGPYPPSLTGLRVYFQVLSRDLGSGALRFDPHASIHLLDF